MLTGHRSSDFEGSDGGPLDGRLADDAAIDAFLAATPDGDEASKGPSRRQRRKTRRATAKKARRDKKAHKRKRKLERAEAKVAKRSARKAERAGRKSARFEAKVARRSQRSSARRGSVFYKVWTRVRERLSTLRRLSPRRVAAGVIVVGLVVAAFLYVERRFERLEDRGATVDQVAQAIGAADGTLTFDLETPSGTRLVVSVDPDGQAFVDASPLSALPEGVTYQLWGATASERVSLAVLGPSPGVELFRLPSSVGSLVITVESGGGAATASLSSMAFGVIPR